MPRFNQKLRPGADPAAVEAAPPQRGEAGPRLTSDALNQLADDYAAGVLVLDDATLQQRFDTIAARIEGREGRGGGSRSVEVTDTSVIVTIDSDKGTLTRAITLDLDSNAITSTLNALSTDGTTFVRERIITFDTDGITTVVEAVGRDGTALGWSVDLDLDDRILTVIGTDGEVHTIAFDDVDATLATGGFARLIGIAPTDPSAVPVA